MKIKSVLNLLLLLNLVLITSCSKNRVLPKENPHFNKQIDDYISSLIKADEIPGMAIAVVQNGQTIHKKNYGLANITHKVPVTDSTLFRVYSTSKIITAVAIFQLIENGKLSLNDSISQYVDNIPALWKEIKIEHLLTHSSGLPDYKNFDGRLSDTQLLAEMAKKPLHFEKGHRHEYNQTNFWFLQMTVEKITNQKFEDFIKTRQFEEDNEQVVYASNSLVAIPNRVPKYQFNNKYNAYETSTFEAGSRSLAGNGLNINLNALIQWNNKLDQSQLIKEETKIQMLRPYNFKDHTMPFGYGWGIYGPQDKQYYGFAGGGVSAIMKFIDKDLTIIILSNGFKNRPVISNAINYISGIADSSLVRKDRKLNEEVRLAFTLNNYDLALKKYKEKQGKNQEISFERALNEVGYHHLFNNDMDKAISIFKLYTEEYPNSANAFDSFGEVYFMNKQYKLSQQNYQKSLDLNPENDNAKKMLAEIEKLN